MLTDRMLAQQIITTLGSYGTPISRGVSYYNAGNQSLLKALDEHYLSSYLAQGGGAFKFVIGKYGAGKSHFLYCLQDLAWERHFAVSLVNLNMKETPYNDQKRVYRAVAEHLTWQSEVTELRSVSQFVQAYLRGKLAEHNLSFAALSDAPDDENVIALLAQLQTLQLDSPSYRNALFAYAKSLFGASNDLRFALAHWLDGEDPTTVEMKLLRPLGIEKITRNNGFKMLRSLCQAVRAFGYTGLAVLFDEGDRLLHGTKRFTFEVLDNLREVVDYCRDGLPGALFVYAVPRKFIEEVVNSYEALKQRISTPYQFSAVNYLSPQIDLEVSDLDSAQLLVAMGEKLLPIFGLARNHTLNTNIQQANIETLAQSAVDSFYDVHPRRLFVKALISEWNRQLAEGEQSLSAEEATRLISVEQRAIAESNADESM